MYVEIIIRREPSVATFPFSNMFKYIAGSNEEVATLLGELNLFVFVYSKYIFNVFIVSSLC